MYMSYLSPCRETHLSISLPLLSYRRACAHCCPGYCLCQPYNVQYLAFYQHIISILIHMHRMQSAMFYWCDCLGLTLTYACGLLNMFLSFAYIYICIAIKSDLSKNCNTDTEFLPARRYASAGYSDRNVSVCLSVCLSVRHAPVLCQNEES